MVFSNSYQTFDALCQTSNNFKQSLSNYNIEIADSNVSIQHEKYLVIASLKKLSRFHLAKRNAIILSKLGSIPFNKFRELKQAILRHSHML